MTIDRRTYNCTSVLHEVQRRSIRGGCSIALVYRWSRKGGKLNEASYWQKTLTTRIGRRRMLATTSGGVAAAALLAACGGSGSDSDRGDKAKLVTNAVDTTKQAKRGGVSKWYFSAEPNSLDIFSGQSPLNQPANFAYSHLTIAKAGHLEPTQNEIIGDLAESWEWSPDRLQLTMKLRQGVKWHNKAPINGRAFDADDVVFSWNRYGKTATDRGSLSNAANPNAPVLSITAVDPKTIVVKLKEPLVYLLSSFASSASGRFGIIPKETDSGFDARKDMLGTGAFILDKYTPSVGISWKRNPDYYDKNFPLVDQVETPFVLEYAQGLAQLKAGNLYHYAVKSEDLFTLIQDVPALKVYKIVPTTISAGDALRFGVLPDPMNKPFQDERVRQAISMSWDRDLYLDTFSGVAKLRSQGLPVDTYWNTSIGYSPGWWLDPKGKDFGPNAKYFQYNPTEAKQLLTAAGYASGISVTSSFVGGPERGVDYQKTVTVKDEFARQVGFKNSPNPVDYNTFYIPKLRDGGGNFVGWTYTSGAPSAEDAVAYMVWRYYSKGAATFLGFDVNGKGDHSGDPYVDAQVDKAKGEIDTERRKALIYDLQRHLGKAMYGISDPGSTTQFQVAWPVLGNFGVFQGDSRGPNFNWWIDETQAPMKKA